MGSRFTVTLPTISANTVQKPFQSAEIEALPIGALNILVVDDNRESAQTLGMMLELLGHEVHIEYDGENAVKAAQETKPDMVLLDIGLPRVNGYEVCQKMRQLPELSRTIFVAQTGWGGERHCTLSREAGFDHHLVKPIEMKTLSGILSAKG